MSTAPTCQATGERRVVGEAAAEKHAGAVSQENPKNTEFYGIEKKKHIELDLPAEKRYKTSKKAMNILHPQQKKGGLLPRFLFRFHAFHLCE